MSWTAIENALHDWVAEATGLAGDRVRFAHADQPRAQDGLPLASINILATRAIGLDANGHRYEPLAPNGQQIVMEASGTRETQVDVSFFSGAVGGDGGARDLAHQALTGLALESVRNDLRTAGVFPFDSGPVRWVPAITGAKFEARAILSMRFYYNDVLEERTTWIETVEVTDETNNETFVVQ
jgi:hypothetical protein